MALEVLKITKGWRHSEQVLYENKAFKNLSILETDYDNDKPQNINLEFHLGFGDQTFIRNHPIKIPHTECIFNHIESRAHFDKFSVGIPPEAWQTPILKIIARYNKRKCLVEKEIYVLIEDWLKLLSKKYHIKAQVPIGNRVADAFAFIDGHQGEILAFEIKTDTDDYSRLCHQIDDYQKIVDKTYLVIESKEPPQDLPWYVGVLKAENGGLKEIQAATSLKHTYDVNEMWITMFNNLRKHIRKGLPRGTETTSHHVLIENFRRIENLKKKLLYNKHCIGFRTCYTNDYVELTQSERKLLEKLLVKDKPQGLNKSEPIN